MNSRWGVVGGRWERKAQELPVTGYQQQIWEVIKIDRAKFDTDTYNKAIHCGKCDDDTNTYYKYDKHMFTVDGLDRNDEIIKEFNGCYFHGCPTCFPECKAKYNKTMERTNLLELAGYKVETMWG